MNNRTVDRKIGFQATLLSFIDRQLAVESEEIDKIQQASNLETKSSAGDKYETTRAMLHLEKEKWMRQFQKTLDQKKMLEQMKLQEPRKRVLAGSLVETNGGWFFFGVSLGKIPWGEVQVQTMTFASPLGKAFLGKAPKDTVLFREKSFEILGVI